MVDDPAGAGGGGNAAAAAAAAAAAGGDDAAAAAAKATAAAAAAAGAPGAGFRAGLSEDIRDNAFLANFDSVDALAKEHINVQTMIGKKGVIPPAAEGTDEDWEKFYANPVLGRPEKAEGYQLKATDGVKVDKELEGWFRGAAHKYGVSQRQASALFNDWNAMTGKREAATVAQNESTLEAAKKVLMEKWGGQAEYDKKMALGNRAVDQYGGDELVAFLAQSGLGVDPRMVAVFAEIGETLHGDGRLVGGREGQFSLTPADAKVQLNELQRNEDNRKILTDKSHPEHAALMARRSALTAAAHPEPGAAK